MKAIVVSDSHGNTTYLLKVLKKHPDYEAIFHLGDVEGDERYLRNLTCYPVYIVKGNCDYGSKAPNELILDFCGKKIWMCHGHKYLAAGLGIDGMVQIAKSKGADVVMFGHTHQQYFKESEGMTVLNPGSITSPRGDDKNPTYAILEVDAGGKFSYEICEVTE